jgi:hopanoid biosynthesis associated protein HpnK
MKQLIVNADDFGLTSAVNAGILYAHRKGIVTSATLMSTGAAFASAVSISRDAPDLGIGVHLNLTSGRPVAPVRKIASLVDAGGRLHLTPGNLLRALVERRISLVEIEIELREQIAKVCKAGIRPTHLDGHKHVHLLPGVSDIVIRLAMEFSIPAIRCPRDVAPELQSLLHREKSQTAVLKQYLIARLASAFARRFALKLAKAGLLFVDRFYGLSRTGFLDLRSVLHILATLPEGVSELMCHPGYVDAGLVNSGTRLLRQREIEINALTAPIVQKIVANRGIELISYEQLGGSTRGEGALCGVLQKGDV